MKLKSGNKRALVGGGTAVLLALAGATGYAVADAGTRANEAKAPHSQVALQADKNGKIIKQEGVASVTRVVGAPGEYCVKPVSTVDAASTIPFAQQTTWIGNIWVGFSGGCQTGEYHVVTYSDSIGTRADRPFRLLVP
ncbi:hypothetical protein [Streptomyces boluensis]|uniref:SH3 domain-containing protein n=1 Tax=Streptomyces boluensis TaxID=1775135 RepID=A0A964URD8_9ACTN|nr:hypothetical protein [Streptomyces boluensis]NBE53056.1 hypothetical protein [Streptomyces boluensis]